jgi:hypothetical protein
VEQGLGSLVLTAALKRNAQEGSPGIYRGTDINPKAGYLFQGSYQEFGTILYGDSIQSLQGIQQKIDLFINDSDHSADYESREYETIAPKLSERAIVLGDNAHATDRLYRFAEKTDRKCLFFGRNRVTTGILERASGRRIERISALVWAASVTRATELTDLHRCSRGTQ